MKIGKNSIVVVRAVNAGVFYGKLDSKEITDGVVGVKLTNARRIWFWSGAASLSQLAKEGVKNPGNCKFSVKTDEHYVFGVCEIIPVTPEALKILDNVPDWRIQ